MLARILQSAGGALLLATAMAACTSHPSAPSITVTFASDGTASPQYSTSCLAQGDCSSLVAQLQSEYGHPSTSDKTFEITRRVAWALRQQGAGLLIKDSGENIIGWGNRSYSICRICFPDGHVWKVMTDCGDGGANGPTWADNGFVETNRYVPAIDPGR